VPLGPALRGLLGQHARVLGRWYRAIFVDLAKEATALSAVLPAGAHVLDVGGGDGEPLNHLLAQRPDLRVTTLDPGPAVGEWIEAAYRQRVTRLADTSLVQYLSTGQPNPDAVLIADVLHHIPEPARHDFLGAVRILLERVPQLRIIVKDVEPGSWRARLGYWSDRYITGDRQVSLISRQRLIELMESELGMLQRLDTNLFETDRPNYAIAFFR
jgi:hypothetical protein